MFAVIIYRLYFHPLAKYPGPFLAKITDAYQLYHAWKGDRHLEFWRQHEQYGRVVRFGPNSVSFNTNTALKEIYGFKSNVRKAEFYDAFVHPAPNTHNARDKQLHARKRRVLSHGFSDGAMKEMERYILANVRTFCEQVGLGASNESKGWTVPKNMADWCNYLAMDILGDLCFGKAFHMLERPDNRYALELVSLATTRHLIVSELGLSFKSRSSNPVTVRYSSNCWKTRLGQGPLSPNRSWSCQVHGLQQVAIDGTYQARRRDRQERLFLLPAQSQRSRDRTGFLDT